MPDVSGPTIAAVETTTVSARAKPGLKVRGQRVVHDASTFTLVRVVTDEGVEGFGEVSATAAWSGEDAVTATHFVRDVIGPRLIGKPLAPIEAHATEFDRVLRGNWFTKAGVSTALWDALGRTQGVTVAELLGGPYRREVPVKISLSGDGDDLRAGYETAVALGFRSFKVKVGRDPEADVARLALARELAGEDALLGADANGGWSLPVALETVPRLAESRLAFIEQPVHADDLEGLRDVRALGVPLVADESVYSPADVARIGRMGAADLVSVYVGKSSGPRARRRVCEARARARDGCRHRRERRDGHRSRRAAACRLRLRAPEPDPARDHRAPLLRGGRLACRPARHRRSRRAAPRRFRARHRAE